MKSLGEIELQLSKLGVNNRFWGRPEVRELQHVLTDEEHITHAANGYYHGGFALILTTNHRLLLIDKKMLFLNLEDIRFDMISEVDYSARLMNATISVQTINKVLRFSSMRQRHLRDLTKYLQDKILELRHLMLQQSQAQQPQMYQAQPQFVMQPFQPYQLQQANYPAQTSDTSTGSQTSEYLNKEEAYKPIVPAEELSPQPGFAQPHFYNTTTNYSRPRALRRIGYYPTSSFTMHSMYYPTRH